jgi:hypothetical protein
MITKGARKLLVRGAEYKTCVHPAAMAGNHWASKLKWLGGVGTDLGNLTLETVRPWTYKINGTKNGLANNDADDKETKLRLQSRLGTAYEESKAYAPLNSGLRTQIEEGR